MKILSAGIASVQDLGRPGFRNLGIHRGGVMDRMATMLCNLLVANETEAAVVEIGAGKWSAVSTHPKLMAVGGNGHRVWSGNKEIHLWQPFLLAAGETLRITAPNAGYATLAVHGGIRCPTVLNSRSTHITGRFGGWEGRLLQAGDELPTAVLVTQPAQKIISLISGKGSHRNFRLSDAVTPNYQHDNFRFFRGHEADWFELHSLQDLETTAFEPTALSNRTGSRLRGKPLLVREQRQMLSTAVVPGTMQVSPDGQILVLLSDAQTSGGYPRIGQLAFTDIGLLAQQKPGNQIRFTAIQKHEAEDLYLKQEHQFRQLKKDYELYFG